MAGRDVALSLNGGASNSVSSFSEFSLYGHVIEAQTTFYDEILGFMDDFGDGDGTVVLSNGMEIDPNSLSGMTVFTTHMQFLNAFIELINNTFTFVKSFEQKLGNSI